MSDKIFRYKFYDCKVVKDHFSIDSSICLNLIAANTEFNQSNDIFPNEPIARASAFLDHVKVEANQTIVRDYAETKGLTDVLVENGIVEKVREVDFGRFPSGAGCKGWLVNVLI